MMAVTVSTVVPGPPRGAVGGPAGRLPGAHRLWRCPWAPLRPPPPLRTAPPDNLPPRLYRRHDPAVRRRV